MGLGTHVPMGNICPLAGRVRICQPVSKAVSAAWQSQV